jgi:hypothetical protein
MLQKIGASPQVGARGSKKFFVRLSFFKALKGSSYCIKDPVKH